MHREQFKEQAILISFLAVLGLTFWIFARMMMPFALALFVGGVLALLFKPAYEKLSEKRLNKYLAASIIALFFVILILGPMTAFTILAIKQGSALFQDLAGRETLSIQKLMTYLYTLPFVEDVLGSAEQLTLTIEQSLKSLAKEGSTQALGGLAQVPFGIIQILLALLSFFFFLIDGEDLVDWVFEKLPLQPAVETRVKEAFQNIAVSIVWATLVAALVQALLILIAFSIFKMPGPFFAAGAT
ncbi:MAG: AI-2E family transporter, partial [Oligoflexia bacterium]|nr:AI-2E family transporter [Oligoflexia bacterium]